MPEEGDDGVVFLVPVAGGSLILNPQAGSSLVILGQVLALLHIIPTIHPDTVIFLLS